MSPRFPRVRTRVILSLTTLLTVIVFLTSGLLTKSLHADTPQNSTDEAAVARSAQGSTRALEAGDEIRVASPRATLMIEIDRILLEQKEDIDALRIAFDKSASPEQALELQRRIEQRKREAEIAIYSAQIVYLKQLGREDSIAKLEMAIQHLSDPQQ